jgi:hypothetical protein
MPPSPDSSPPFADGQRRIWFRFLLCCFAIICGLRILLVEKFGAPVAWGDDLDGIAHRILAPLNNGTFSWSLLFTAHNGDHVIAATRLWEMLWYSLNGEWDPKLVMIVKVPIYAAAMTIFIHLLTRGLTRSRFLAAGVLTALFAFPFNYHNLLWAFQSQFDFFFLAAALGWLALLNDRPWWALLCALAAPFTLGAGPVIAVSYVPYFLAAGFVSRRWPMPRALLFVALAIGIAAFGASLPEGEAAPRTGTALEKLAMLLRLYSWPFSNLLSAIERLPEEAHLIPQRILNFPSSGNSWVLRVAGLIDRVPILLPLVHLLIALAIVAPMAAVGWLAWRRRLPLTITRGALNLSVLAGLLMAATALARSGGATIAMRFLDHVMLAGFMSIVAGFMLIAWQPRLRPWMVCWGFMLGLGYLATVGATMSQIVNRRKAEASLEILQRYYVANDHTVMRENNAFKMFIVSDDPTEFMGMLDDPILRPVLPRAITAPGAGRGGVAMAASAVAKTGGILVFLGTGMACWLAWRSRRPVRHATPVPVPGAPA